MATAAQDGRAAAVARRARALPAEADELGGEHVPR